MRSRISSAPIRSTSSSWRRRADDISLVSHRPASLQGEELLLFRDSVRKFLSVQATRDHIDTWRRAGIVPRSFWTAVAEAGFLCMSIPERYGGAGADFRFDMGFVEELAAIGLEAFGAPMHNSVVAPYIEI